MTIVKDPKPFFSIVIPTFNRTQDLRFTLFCILRQSFKNYEIIVSDNCSTDDTRSMIQSLHSNKIRYSSNKTNLGFARNVKKGLSLAKGTYVFLHGDDDFLFRKDALFQIYQVVQKFKPGFVRVNFTCRSADKKFVFNFPPNKKFTSDKYLPKGCSGKRVLSFVTDSEQNFITGIMLRNTLLTQTEFLYSEVCPWIDMLLYASQCGGACFISKSLIVASWSQRHKDIHSQWVFYAMIHGKLQAESYIHIVHKYLSDREYQNFLYEYLNSAFVNMFPAIKYYTGRSNLYHTYRRIQVLKPDLAAHAKTKTLFYLSILLPDWLLALLRAYYLVKFMRFSKIKNSAHVEALLDNLADEYTRKRV